jgi:hypothetical protein
MLRLERSYQHICEPSELPLRVSIAGEGMELLITACDGTDAEAMERRLAARGSQLALGERIIAAGSLPYAAAILDDLVK